MKNFLIGCGVVILLVIAVVIGAGWWFVRLGKDMQKQFMVTEEMLQATNKKFPFTPPANGIIPEDRLVIWLELNKKTPATDLFNQDQKRQQGIQNFGKNFKMAFNMMTTMIPTMGQEQARRLQIARMSFNEYKWTASAVIGALNSGDARADPITAKLAKTLEPQNQIPNQRNPADTIRSLGAPLTSGQIAQILPLLKKHEREFLEGSQGLMTNAIFLRMRPTFNVSANAYTGNVKPQVKPQLNRALTAPATAK